MKPRVFIPGSLLVCRHQFVKGHQRKSRSLLIRVVSESRAIYHHKGETVMMSSIGVGHSQEGPSNQCASLLCEHNTFLANSESTEDFTSFPLSEEMKVPKKTREDSL